jgi:tetratricopeptide (TPR) repeat protein
VHDQAQLRASRAFAAIVLLALIGCSKATSSGSAAPTESATKTGASAAAALKPAPRAKSEGLTRLRQALDHGRRDEARALLEQNLAPEPEASLLKARAAALEGRNTEAMRAIEDARGIAPTDPTVFATAAEFYAATGSTDTAVREILRGEQVCGASPEFLRARGILAISQTGRAQKGLELLEQARAADPEIPFIDRALGQAHLLVAKEHDKAKDVSGAVEHARASLEFDPDDVDARRLLAEVLTQSGDLKGAIAVLQSLFDAGEPIEAELALTLKNAGMLAILHGEREEALTDFAAARKHGLTASELGWAATQLSNEAKASLDRGVDAYEKQDLEGAERDFRRALELDPDLIQARNHLAVVMFKKRDFCEAARLWRTVITSARSEKIDLPEPVHLNLAKAEVQCGDRASAELVLEEYLDRQPNGEWVAPTREMLDALRRVAERR